MDIEIQTPETGSYAVEVAVFCVLIGALSLYGLNSLHGRFTNIKRYISGQAWYFLKSSPSCHSFYIWYFNVIITLIVFMCPTAFAIWCIILFYNEHNDDHDYMPPVAITLVGASTITFALAFFSFKWNKYKFTLASLILLFIAGVCFMAYQISGNFQIDTERSFFGLSSVFLTCNAIIFMFIIFLNEGKHAANFFGILEDKLDIKYEKIVSDEELLAFYQILDKRANSNYIITKSEINFFFTIESKDTALISGGILMDYTLLSNKTQILISTLIYIVSIAVLIAYSFIIYETVREYKLGFVTMIATITTDTIIYLFYYVKVSQSMFQLCFTAIIFRMCLFIFGGSYWYYGYCLLYGLLGIIINLNISAKYFPLITTINPIQRSFYSSNFRIELKDLMRTPEFILLYSSIMFTIITVCMIVFEPNGVPLPSLYSSGNEYPFWNMALLSFGVIVLSYLLFAIARIILRRKQQIIDEVHVYFFKTFINIFWIHIYLCYGLFIIAGLVGYGLTSDPMYLIIAVFIPLIVILLINVYIYYVANDYRMVKDISAENQRRLAMVVTREKRVKEQAQEKDRETVEEDQANALNSKGSRVELDSEEEVQPNMNLERLPRQDSKDALDFAMRELDELRVLEDWQAHYNGFTAFWAGKLHSNDYMVILGYIGIILLIFLNSLTLELTNDNNDSHYGITLGIILLDVFLVICGCFNYLVTDLPIKPMNIVSIVIAIIIHLIYGTVYFAYDEKSDLDVNGNLVWFWFYLFIVPPLLIIIMGIYKWYRQKWKFNIFTLIMSIVFMAIEIVFGIHIWIRYSWVGGIIIILITILLMYEAVFIYFYAANNYSMSVCLYVSNITVCIIVACLIMASGWVIEANDPYVSFSITYGVIVIGGMLYFFGKIFYMCRQYETNPVFISPYVFPVYAYSSTKKATTTKNFNVAVAYITILLLLIWGVITSVFIQPMHYGISFTCLAIVLFVFISFFLIALTPTRFKEYQKWLTRDVLTDAWLEAKKLYIESEKIKTLEKLVTYKYLCETHTKITRRSEITEVRLTPFDRREIDINGISNADQDNLLAELETNIRKQYFEELELMIEFGVTALLLAANAEVNYRRKMLKFTDENRKALAKLGMDVELKGVANQKLKYSLIMNQIEKLLPKHKRTFDRILTKYEKEQEKKKQQEEEREQAEEEERRQKIKTRSKPKIDLEAEKFLPIDEMSDSLQKYNKIWEMYESSLALGTQYKYEDKQFTPSDKSMGANLCARFNSWQEVNPKDEGESKMILYDNTGFGTDVKQGALGDCYFLSALIVMGEKYLKKCLYTYPNEIGCGVYCVRFFNDDKQEEFVLVDDYFPVDNTGQWAFAKSESGKELWPMILEKAYAKFFGSYENIEAGKVHYALADLTGGVPEQIKLEDESKNYDEFCKKIFSYYEAGYLMGAGSNANRAGDTATINGIVQSHAYGILELAEFNDEKLIKLRNPHGSGGVEWSGDWSDESNLWTEAAKGKLNYNILNKRDGVFWMNLTDFIFNFDNLYVCRIFGKSWVREEAEGEWDPSTTPGLPNDSHADPKMETNPHYLLYVTKPSTLFVELSQCETINMFQGKQSIYFFIGNNKGKKISKTTKDIRVCSSYPPTNLITITKEVMLDNNYFYPISLSLMVCTEAKGVSGKYLLKVYCTDENFTLSKM